MLLGDSVFERFYWNTVEVGGQSCAIINAGYGGIDSRALLTRVSAVVLQAKPKFAVVLVGDIAEGVDEKLGLRPSQK